MTEIEIESLQKYAIADLVTRAEFRAFVPGLNPAFDVIDFCESRARIKILEDVKEDFAEISKTIEKISKL